MATRYFKNGRQVDSYEDGATWICQTQRGHRKQPAYTSPGEPIPPDRPRVGTRRLTKAGTGGGKSRGLHGGNGGLARRKKINELRGREGLS